MTHAKGTMRIFRQKGYFSKVLVIWEARVQALIVLKAKLYFSLKFF
jgi:hypothetical protein